MWLQSSHPKLLATGWWIRSKVRLHEVAILSLADFRLWDLRNILVIKCEKKFQKSYVRWRKNSEYLWRMELLSKTFLPFSFALLFRTVFFFHRKEIVACRWLVYLNLDDSKKELSCPRSLISCDKLKRSVCQNFLVQFMAENKEDITL